MSSIDDSTTGGDSVNDDRSLAKLTSAHESAVVTGSTSSLDKVSVFLRKVLPVIDRDKHDPISALVPWVCDVLQSKRSLESYGEDLRDFVDHMGRLGIDPLNVTADHLKVYKAALREAGRAPGTVARKLSVLRGVYRQFAEKGLIRWDTYHDFAAVQAPRVQKNTTPALTELQAIQLLRAPDTNTLEGIRDRAMLHTFFITACRVSAITRACIGHLEFDGTDHYLNVTEKRGKKQRKILLDSARAIQAYCRAAGITDDTEGPLFRPLVKNGKGFVREPLHRASVWRIVKKYCRVAGINPGRLGGRGVGVHSLRKTALNNAIQNGAQLHEVRELAGHADIRTTELYFVRRDEDAERAARRIHIR